MDELGERKPPQIENVSDTPNPTLSTQGEVGSLMDFAMRGKDLLVHKVSRVGLLRRQEGEEEDILQPGQVLWAKDKDGNEIYYYKSDENAFGALRVVDKSGRTLVEEHSIALLGSADGQALHSGVASVGEGLHFLAEPRERMTHETKQKDVEQRMADFMPRPINMMTPIEEMGIIPVVSEDSAPKPLQ